MMIWLGKKELRMSEVEDEKNKKGKQMGQVHRYTSIYSRTVIHPY